MARSLSGRRDGTGSLQSPALEALSEALLFDRVRTVGRADLDAGLVAREDLAGVAEARRVEGVLHLVHARQVGLREDERHVVGLLEPDAVLARDRAAHLGTDLEDLGPHRHHPRLLA